MRVPLSLYCINACRVIAATLSTFVFVPSRTPPENNVPAVFQLLHRNHSDRLVFSLPAASLDVPPAIAVVAIIIEATSSSSPFASRVRPAC